MIDYKTWCDLAEHAPEKLFTEHGAASYVPLSAKMSMINIATLGLEGEENARPLCIQFDEAGFATVSTTDKYLFLMQIYLIMYFDVDFGESIFSSTEYDEIQKKGLQQRINRLADKASTSKIKHQVIEQQNDFKLFEKMLNKELADEVARLNDPVKRAELFADAFISQIKGRIEADLSPEKVQKATEELKKLTDEIDKRQAELHIVKQ